MTDTLKQIDDGGLAFHGTRWQQVGTVAEHGFTDDDSPTYADVRHSGMTLRDWFAGQALVGLTNAFVSSGWHNPNAYQLEVLAKGSFAAADFMIAARKAGA